MIKPTKKNIEIISCHKISPSISGKKIEIYICGIYISPFPLTRNQKFYSLPYKLKKILTKQKVDHIRIFVSFVHASNENRKKNT